MMRFVLVLMVLASGVVNAEPRTPVVTKLRAEYRYGQTFLTWQESAVPVGTTFNVYLSRRPIVDTAAIADAKQVCRWIETRSAEDWTRDKGNYGKGRVKDAATGQIPPVPEPLGYIVQDGAKRLDPTSGLHVHTISTDEQGNGYYAVTTVVDGREDRTIVPGENALRDPVAQKCEQIRPIWQGEGTAAAPDSGRGKPLHLVLHAKGNRPACKYIVFGDSTHAWREGIPFMFDVAVRADSVLLLPSNTMYVGRSFRRGIAATGDIRGIWTFWYGCSDKIPQPEDIETGTPTNYSERRLLFEIDWVKRYLGTDPNRTYCSGSSMGGCGAMSFAFRHPEIFAAVSAQVPIVAYNDGDEKKGVRLGWHSNSHRLVSFCGPLSLTCSDGIPLSKRMDSTDFVLSHPGDLPFLIIANGRQDTSIPWHNNPDLYRALQKMRHGCQIAWNDGIHSEVANGLPPDFLKWKTTHLTRFALSKSYPAFSNSSANNEPGNGDNNSGDIVGYINRGLNWTEPKETTDRYELLVTYDAAADDLPLSVDVTPRRCQTFRLPPGQTCTAANVDATGQTIQSMPLKADRWGLVTFLRFRVTSPEGNRLILTK